MQHKDIPDNERHEPKGVSTATQGSTYVADGTGSGAWTLPAPADKGAYGELYSNLKTISVATAGTYYDIQALTTGASHNMTVNATDGTLSITEAGTYRLSFNAVSSLSENTKQDISFRYMLNGTPSARTLSVTSSHTGEKQAAAANALLVLQSGDVLKIQITCDAIRDVLLSDFSINAVKLFK